MFNEAFWFFYLIGFIETLREVIPIVITLAGCGTLLAVMIYFAENVKQAKKWITILPVSCVLMLLVYVVLPSTQALYAGGTQYAVQAMELDDTLIAFKDIIDTKIAGFTPTEGE